MSNFKFCIFDTETTGLPIKNNYSHINLLELGYIIVDENLNILKKYNSLIRGNFDIPPKITEITGIDKHLTNKEGKYRDEVLKEFYKDIKSCDFLIAHNIYFDYNILKNEFKRINKKYYMEEFYSKIQICSLRIFRNQLPKPLINNHKLETVYNHLHNEYFIQTHRAIDDVLMIRSCFLKINNLNIMDYFFNKTVNIGKYKGKKYTYKYILDNDFKYYNYMLRKFHNINPSRLKLFLK